MSTARRAGGMLYQVLADTGLEFDEVMHSYVAQAKPFFVHPRCQAWLAGQVLTPALLLSNRLAPPSRQARLEASLQPFRNEGPAHQITLPSG